MIELSSFEALKNHLGLVPMKILHPEFAPYELGSIAGFPPERAAQLFEAGDAVPTDANGIPLVIEPIADEIGEVIPAAPTVAIPYDWDGAHHLTRIRLAKEISGTDGSMTAERATEIIRAELTRRGASHAAQE